MSRSKAFSALSVAAVLFSACGGPNPTVISGTLLGHDSEPMVAAGVRLSRWSTRDIPDTTDGAGVLQVAEDGSFSVETFETGLLAVRFVGAYHERQDVPIYADTALHVELDVRLGTSEHSDVYDNLRVVGSFSDYDPGGVGMDLQSDGSYAAEIDTDDSVVTYLLLESKPGNMHLFHGTDSDEFVFGDWGEYEAVVRPIDGTVSIVFDPSRLSHTERGTQVIFREPDSFVALVAGKLLRVNDRYDVYREARSNNEEEEFTYDWSEDIATLEAELVVEQDSVVRQILFLDLMRIQSNDGEVDQGMIERGLQEIDPKSHLWSFKPDLMLTAVEYLSRPATALADSFSNERLLAALDAAESSLSTDVAADVIVHALNDHPDPELQTYLFDQLLWVTGEVGDSAKQTEYYERLVAGHPNSMQTDYWQTILSPDRNIAVGKEIPDFSVVSLEDSTLFHTREALMATVYLIDFWATWCAPCIAELPNVHDAFDRFKDSGFQVLSVAIGDEKEAIADFRTNEQPMPWLHAFHGWEDAAVAPFEVVAIPRAILVGADGVILASDAECRGERLHEAIERVLGGND